jgi:hypothetical protein
LHKKSNTYKNNSKRVYTTNCHLKTDSKFTSRSPFLELWGTTNFLTQFLYSFTLLRRNRKYISAPPEKTFTV